MVVLESSTANVTLQRTKEQYPFILATWYTGIIRTGQQYYIQAIEQFEFLSRTESPI